MRGEFGSGFLKRIRSPATRPRVFLDETQHRHKSTAFERSSTTRPKAVILLSVLVGSSPLTLLNSTTRKIRFILLSSLACTYPVLAVLCTTRSSHTTVQSSHCTDVPKSSRHRPVRSSLTSLPLFRYAGAAFVPRPTLWQVPQQDGSLPAAKVYPVTIRI